MLTESKGRDPVLSPFQRAISRCVILPADTSLSAWHTWLPLHNPNENNTTPYYLLLPCLQHIIGKVMLKWINEWLYSNLTLFKKNSINDACGLGLLVFGSLAKMKGHWCWIDNVGHRTCIATEAGLLCGSDPHRADITATQWADTSVLLEYYLGIHHPCALTQVPRPVCLPHLEWGTKVTRFLLLNWISCV